MIIYLSYYIYLELIWICIIAGTMFKGLTIGNYIKNTNNKKKDKFRQVYIQINMMSQKNWLINENY